MTTASHVVDSRPAVLLWAVAGLGGIALGAVDLLAQVTLPYPWANLANSSAVWALAAFALGVWVRRGPVRCAAAAVVLLVVAVEAYRLAAIAFLGNDVTTLVAPAHAIWMVFGVLAGCVFGVGGHLRAVRGRWLAAAGAALPVAVLLAEAALSAGGRVDRQQTAVIEVALAVVVALVAGRGWFGKGVALVLAVPLAVVGWVAFRLAGFAG